MPRRGMSPPKLVAQLVDAILYRSGMNFPTATDSGGIRIALSQGVAADLRRLRWTAIVLPVLFLVLLDFVRESTGREFWHSPLGVVLTLAGVAGAVSAFAVSVFREFERFEASAARRTARIAALNRLAAVAGDDLDLVTSISRGLDEVMAATGADASLVCRLDLRDEVHTALDARGFSSNILREIQRAKISQDVIASEVVRTGKAVRWGAVFGDPEVRQVSTRDGLQSGISVPLVSSGAVNGIVVVAYREAHEFDRDDYDFLQGIGQQLGMAIHNAQLYEDSLRQNRDLSLLLHVQSAVSSSLLLDDVLSGSLQVVTQFTSADAGEVWVPNSDLIVLRRADPAEAEPLLGVSASHRNAGILGRATAGSSTIRVTSREPDFPSVLAAKGYRACCATPLRFRGTLVGVMLLAAFDEQAIAEPSDLRLLDAIGDQIAPAIENANLHNVIEEVSILGERERISREVHDGVGQVLGYVNTQVQAIRKLLENGQFDTAQEELSRLDTAARSVYSDVRDGILALRSSSAGHSMLDILTEHIDAYREMFELDARLEVTDEARRVHLPAGSDIQIVRIVQQALSNVRQHAGASRVRARISVDGDVLVVEVVDDGVGFRPEALPAIGRPRFGLQMMRERAEAAGGTFAVDSEAGRGTRITARIPIRQ